MNWLDLAAAVLLGYLLGSIPIGYLVGKLWGVDVRETGSGRTGGTNVWRASGKIVPALLTMAGDSAKGAVAILLARKLFMPSEAAAALAGAAAVYGHIWPVFLRFRGGAGGATSAIGWITLSPMVGVFNLVFSLYVLAISRFASLGTLTVGVGGVLLAILVHLLRPDLISPWDLAFGVLVFIGMLITLQPNLHRLREGTERRISLW